MPSVYELTIVDKNKKTIANQVFDVYSKHKQITYKRNNSLILTNGIQSDAIICGYGR